MVLSSSDLILVRHAPAETHGRLCGRLDSPLRGGGEEALTRLSAALRTVRHVVTSPALRCRQTAQAVCPLCTMEVDERLWEQDFGEEDGMALTELPDLGTMSREELATRCPPKGESFVEMARRVAPALESYGPRAQVSGPLVIVAHAGTVRAGLALALGSEPAALAFEVAPLSITRLRRFEGGWSILCVNAMVWASV